MEAECIVIVLGVGDDWETARADNCWWWSCRCVTEVTLLPDVTGKEDLTNDDGADPPLAVASRNAVLDFSCLSI